MSATTPGYVYLIHAIGTNRYKIGVTRNAPEERLRQLNSKQSPYVLKLKGYITTSDIFGVESALHQYFAGCATEKNEWFAFDESDMQKVYQAFKQYHEQEEEPEPTYYPQSSYYDDGIGIGAFAAIIIGVIVVGVFSQNIPKKGFDPKLATPQEKELRKNFIICTDGIANNDRHLICNNIVNDYQKKFGK